MSNWIAAIKASLRSLFKVFKQGNKPPVFFTNKLLFSVLAQLMLYWLLSGIIVLRAPMEAVVTRFGDYQRTLTPGIHWHLRFVERVFKLEVNQPKREVCTLSAFTADANLITASLEVEHSITDSRLFIFGTTDPQEYFLQALRASLQSAMSRYTLVDLLNNKTSVLIQKEIKEALKKELEKYPCGINLLSVRVPQLKPPLELKKDFEVLQKTTAASQDTEAKATLESKQLTHETELKIQALYTEANIQKHKTINKAKAETDRFLALLPYYEKHPELTLQRLQCEKTEKILKYPAKVLLIQPKGKFTKDIVPIQLSLDKALLEIKESTPVNKESHHAA